MFYLDFHKANCKNCYKCLRACPAKAIDMRSSRAKIIESRCVLCGHCTKVCPQNAKSVRDDTAAIERLLEKKTVIASVAPSFLSSFCTEGFEPFRNALKAIGFADAFETSEGAAAVTLEYKKLLQSGEYENLITSACPAVNRAIQLYHHDVLKYLAPVDSPMVAHAKILKSRYPKASIVFIGPCIAKKREAAESGIIAGALTYEELTQMFERHGINVKDLRAKKTDKSLSNVDTAKPVSVDTTVSETQKSSTVQSSVGEESVKAEIAAKFYPIPRGIIKSFDEFPKGYEYIAVDGVDRLSSSLDDLRNNKGIFLEINACAGSCVNGPCSIPHSGGTVDANVRIRNYTNSTPKNEVTEYPSLLAVREAMRSGDRSATEAEIAAVLAKTGKCSPADELNCGACGYATCREKAWAVVNGYAEVEMCVPYMRERAESKGNVIIENSPNGIIVCDMQLKISEINRTASMLVGQSSPEFVFDCFDPTAVFKAAESGMSAKVDKLKIDKTDKYVDINIVPLVKEKSLLIVLLDVTDKVNYDAELQKVKRETLAVADSVVSKQMRVAQEIASLLGETTAETKIALFKLKNAMIEDEN